MSAKTNNLKLGVFTVVGVGLLVAGILIFGTWKSFAKKSAFESYFQGDVTGLSVGSEVDYRGVHVGKVTSIGFSWNEYEQTQPGYVVVHFEMRDDVFAKPHEGSPLGHLLGAIERGLRARVKTQGISGSCIVSLEYMDPDENPVQKFSWTPKNTFIPSAPGAFEDLLDSLEKILHHLNRLDVKALNDLAVSDLKGVGRVVDRVERVDFEQLSTNANSLLQELRQSNVKLKGLIGNADGVVNKMQLEKLSKDADTLVEHLTATIDQLKPGLTSVDFNAINQTLSEARHAIQNLDAVLDELKEYPSGFLFGKPPGRLKDVEPPK